MINELPIEKWSPANWKRDPDSDCDGFVPVGEASNQHPYINADCETDGHYMCVECIFMKHNYLPPEECHGFPDDCEDDCGQHFCYVKQQLEKIEELR